LPVFLAGRHEVLSTIEQPSQSSGNVLGFRLSGEQYDEDYKTFVPAVDTVPKTHDKLRLLALFQDFRE
jgi:hypothetical protein